MAKSPFKLLVVDDLEDWRKTIRGVLEDQEYEVSVAGSAGDAISLLGQNKYDLALLDLRLDESDEENEEGLALAKDIRERWPKVKIVIVTGYGTPEVVQQSMAADSEGKRLLDDFLPKDNTDKLVETVQRILGK